MSPLTVAAADAAVAIATAPSPPPVVWARRQQHFSNSITRPVATCAAFEKSQVSGGKSCQGY